MERKKKAVRMREQIKKHVRKMQKGLQAIKLKACYEKKNRKQVRRSHKRKKYICRTKKKIREKKNKRNDRNEKE